jgi:hypothetical protein
MAISQGRCENYVSTAFATNETGTRVLRLSLDVSGSQQLDMRLRRTYMVYEMLVRYMRRRSGQGCSQCLSSTHRDHHGQAHPSSRDVHTSDWIDGCKLSWIR